MLRARDVLTNDCSLWRLTASSKGVDYWSQVGCGPDLYRKGIDHMNNAITARANGNHVTYSRDTDSRIVAVSAEMATVFCASAKAARELRGEAKAWGITSVIFEAPAARKTLGCQS
jgi:hypothetical protein